MSDYIKREFILAELDYAVGLPCKSPIQAYCVARRIVEDIPTADVIERKRGEWVDAKGAGWKCSACGKWNNETSNYCPNCGARMKGADDGE